MRFVPCAGRVGERTTEDDVPLDAGAADLHDIGRHGADVRGVYGAALERSSAAWSGAYVPTGKRGLGHGAGGLDGGGGVRGGLRGVVMVGVPMEMGWEWRGRGGGS